MKKFGLGVAVALSTLCGTTVAWGQEVSYSPDFHLGTAMDVASGGAEQYAIASHHGSAEGKILRRSGNGWQEFAAGTTATQIAVSDLGAPWILRSNGSIYKWNGASFVRKGTSSNCFTALGVGVVDTDAWALGCSGTSKRVYRWDGSSWFQPESTARALDIAVGSDNNAWLLADGQTAWRWNGVQFEFISGNVFVVGGNGWVVADQLDQIWRYSGGGWTYYGTIEDTVTVLTGDGRFLLHHNEQIWNQQKFESFQARSTPAFGIEISVRGRYFNPNQATKVSWVTPGGQLRQLKTLFAPTTGVINVTNTPVLSTTDCFTLGSLGLRRSSGPQTMQLENLFRWATITTDSLRAACVAVLPD